MNKTTKTILIGVAITGIAAVLGWLFTTVISCDNRLSLEEKDLIYINTRVTNVDSLQNYKNKNTNKRIDKVDDDNTNEHQSIKDDLEKVSEDVVTIKMDVAEIKGMLKYAIKNNLITEK